MLRINQQTSATGACSYFENSLSRSDYYEQRNEVAGMWGGRGAMALGLSGEVSKEDFRKLCYNINPSGGKLTARNDANRTVLYDWCYSIPKSVSIIQSQTRDPDITLALNTAIAHTMNEVEKSAETRVRKGKKNENRITGNLIWAAFTHEEARPVKGISDPHTHTHVTVFNATYDEVEKKWKAGQFRNLKADAPYYEAVFNNRLAYELQKAGYSIERTAHNFEVTGFKRSTIEKFSTRTLEVNEKIKQLGLQYAEDKAKIGQKTRANKRTGLDKGILKKDWTARLDAGEIKLIKEAKNKNRSQGDTQKGDGAARAAIDHALLHGLERKSVISHQELMISALKYSLGKATKEQLEKEINSRKDLLSKNDKNKKIYTTTAAIEEEKKLIQAARSGRGQCKPLNPEYTPKNKDLNEEQKNAIKHALQSKDYITLITGRAGVGKTWSIKEVALGVQEKGIGFHAFAPSSTASRDVQQQEGFSEATTIAMLLQDKKLHEQIKGGVIWIDEAGLVGAPTLNQLVSLAKNNNARLLLTGDIKQHSAIERGDGLKIIQKYGGIIPAYINKIQRQQKENYKEAIKFLSEGNIKKGFHSLDQMGSIKEHSSFDETVMALSKEYVEARKAREDALIVSTTHSQGHLVTKVIRESLKKEGKLSKKERGFDIQINLSFTEAQKKDHDIYEHGQAVQFHQNIKGFNRGEKYDVIGHDEKRNVLISYNGTIKTLPLHEAKKFSVYKKDTIEVAKNDLLRITQNGFSKNEKRLNNSNILTVKGFTEDGNIIAHTGKNEIILDKDYRNFTHGYYTTSPASQGKSVNRVLVLQTSQSGKAANKEQFYVSASRGKFEVSIYTDNKSLLFDSVQKTSERMSAMEIAHAPSNRVKLLKEKIKGISNATRSRVTEITEAIQSKIEKTKAMRNDLDIERGRMA